MLRPIVTRIRNLVSLAVFFCSLLHAQQIVILKSGEKINGRITSFSPGKLTLKFRGNLITLHDSVISAIYFDSLQLKTDFDAKRQEFSELNGVVTYYFNKNYGDMPDVGGNVYITPAEQIQIDSLTFPRYRIFAFAKDHGVPSYSPSDSMEIHDPDKEAFDACHKIRTASSTIHLVTDGNGRFSHKVLPGLYYVLIISAHRTATTATETLGKIHFEVAMIRYNDQSAVNARFDVR